MLLIITTLKDEHGNSPITNCSDGTYCCGADEANSCCQSSTSKFRLAATIGLSSSTSSDTSGTATPGTTTSPAQGTTTLGSTNTAAAGGNGLSPSSKIGIGVGVPVGILAALAVGVSLGYAYRRRKGKFYELEATEAGPGSGKLPGPQTLRPIEADGTSRAEME
jgi:hypothetical protein